MAGMMADSLATLLLRVLMKAVMEGPVVCE